MQHRAGGVLQNPALWLLFSHAFGKWPRFFQGCRFSLGKKMSTLQNCSISYDSFIWRTGFQWNPRRVYWWPTGLITLLSAGGPKFPVSSLLAYSFCETLPKLATGTHKWTALPCGLCLVTWPWHLGTPHHVGAWGPLCFHVPWIRAGWSCIQGTGPSVLH